MHIWIFCYYYYCWILFHCMDVPHCLSINQLLNIWVVSYFWLLGIMLMWAFTYNILCKHVHLTILSTFFSVKFLGHVAIGNSIFNFLRSCQTAFQSSCTILNTLPPIIYDSSNFSKSSKHLLLLIFYCNHSNEGEKVFHSNLVLVFLMTNNIEHLFMELLTIFSPVVIVFMKKQLLEGPSSTNTSKSHFCNIFQFSIGLIIFFNLFLSILYFDGVF